MPNGFSYCKLPTETEKLIQFLGILLYMLQYGIRAHAHARQRQKWRILISVMPKLALPLHTWSI